jgi:hypothetical protein
MSAEPRRRDDLRQVTCQFVRLPKAVMKEAKGTITTMTEVMITEEPPPILFWHMDLADLDQ